MARSSDKNSAASDVYGKALLSYWEGAQEECLLLEYRDGRERRLPVAGFFRTAADLFDSERAALSHVSGDVLDVGAGTGVHSLLLQEAGHAVTALDVSPGAVTVMRARGVTDARCEDFFEHDGQYDTILLLGLNLGVCGELARLPALLNHCRRLLRPGGRVLANSVAEERVGCASTVRAYPGDLEFRFRVRTARGPWVAWLHVDFETLRSTAEREGFWATELARDPDGPYSVMMTRANPTYS